MAIHSHSCVAFLVISLGGAGIACGADTSRYDPGGELKVGVVEAAPFAMAGGQGRHVGLAVEAWQRAARALGWSYTLQPLDYEAAVERLQQGDLDAVIGDVVVSPALVNGIDSTIPFFVSNIGIAYKPRAKLGTLGVLFRTFVSVGFLKVVLSMLGVLVLVGGIILLIERNWRNEEFGQGRSRGALYGIYWAAAMMSGVGERTPTTVRGRALALVWIFMGIFITSSFTAAITSNVTAEAIIDRAPTRSDLPRLRVAVPKGTFEDALLRMGGRVEIVGSEQEAVAAVAGGRADVCVGSEPVLRHEVTKAFGGHLDVTPVPHRQTLHVFALRVGSPLRIPLNQAIVETVSNPDWLQVRSKYLD
ncbi:MAG TPA: transporter substrate-binding domain-containing protein [Verrucomicrobiae bacterium]|nr:transporter substrate-binding domain-containing protein [Verrucomicrobiae bacterium]